MSKQFWADACRTALAEEGSSSAVSLLYGSHGLAIACFLGSSAFAGFWLNRWRRVKQSNPELLLSVWRYMGRFLCLSFLSAVFGTAAWISKLAQVYVSSAYASANNDIKSPTLECQRFYALNAKYVTIQATFRIFYSLEFACLIVSIILGLDRISELAHSAKILSKENAPASREAPAKSNVAGRGLLFVQKTGLSLAGRSTAAQQELLLPADAAPVPSRGSSVSKFGRTRALRLVFTAGLAFVALCFIAALVSIIFAASVQARAVSLYQSAFDACNLDGTQSEASVRNFISAAELTRAPLMKPIFAGFVSEFGAAIVVILLYVAIGCLGVSIVGTARKTIECSRVKLQQLQSSLIFIGNQNDAKAASAGAARRLCLRGAGSRAV